MNVLEATMRIAELEQALKKAEHDRDRYKKRIDTQAADHKMLKRLNDLRSRTLAVTLFTVIRNTTVALNGMQPCATQDEIDDVTYAAMLEITDMIDFETVNPALTAAAHRYVEREVARRKGD